MHGASSRRGSQESTPTEIPQGTLWRGIGYLRSHRLVTIGAYVSLVIASIGILLVPLFTQRIIDDGLSPADPSKSDTDVVLLFSILMIVVALVSGIFLFLQGYWGEVMSQYVAFDLRNAIYEKIQRLSFSYHDRSQTGQLMTRATSDVEQLRLFIGQGLLLGITAVLQIIGVIIILVVLNLPLTLVLLPTLIITTSVFQRLGKKAGHLFRTVQEKLGIFNTILQENLAGIRVVKAFGRENHERDRFQAANHALRDASLRTSRIMATLFPTALFLSSLGLILVVWVGGYLVIEADLALGKLIAFTAYLALLMNPIAQLGFIVASASQARASAARVFEIMDAKNDIEDQADAIEMKPIEGHVVFENVSFRYFKSSATVLSQVSFEAKRGQTVALLGATGSGKSTIINLIPRFYDVSEGRVLIDGQDVHQVKIDSLRKQIGIVLQETNLFSGTIRDNIAFGRSDASQAQIEEAARAAAAHDFIMEFPQGYDTIVGERGVTLSGGQRQRIAIARALILDPRILILDDSTSSVDLQTEYHIQKALDRLMAGRTSFVIAQRISTVLNADKILVLDKGRLVAEGTHETLMEESPIYAEIYNSQLIDDRDQKPTFEIVSLVKEEV